MRSRSRRNTFLHKLDATHIRRSDVARYVSDHASAASVKSQISIKLSPCHTYMAKCHAFSASRPSPPDGNDAGVPAALLLEEEVLDLFLPNRPRPARNVQSRLARTRYDSIVSRHIQTEPACRARARQWRRRRRRPLSRASWSPLRVERALRAAPPPLEQTRSSRDGQKLSTRCGRTRCRRLTLART